MWYLSVPNNIQQWLNVLMLTMYEISTLYLIMLKHRKSLILLKKLVFISNFNVFILIKIIFISYSSYKP